MFGVSLPLFLIVVVNYYFITETMLDKNMILINIHNIIKVVGTPIMSYIFFLVCLCKVLNKYPILLHLGLHFFIGMLIIFWVMISTIKSIDPQYFNNIETVSQLFLTRKMALPILYIFLGSITFSIIEYFLIDNRLTL